jgi:hypothetical protein
MVTLFSTDGDFKVAREIHTLAGPQYMSLLVSLIGWVPIDDNKEVSLEKLGGNGPSADDSLIWTWNRDRGEWRVPTFCQASKSVCVRPFHAGWRCYHFADRGWLCHFIYDYIKLLLRRLQARGSVQHWPLPPHS